MLGNEGNSHSFIGCIVQRIVEILYGIIGRDYRFVVDLTVIAENIYKCPIQRFNIIPVEDLLIIDTSPSTPSPNLNEVEKSLQRNAIFRIVVNQIEDGSTAFSDFPLWDSPVAIIERSKIKCIRK